MPPTPPKKPERMSSVDTAWLRMDRPTNLMMICGVLIFGERLTLARLKATLSDRFLRFARFRTRVRFRLQILNCLAEALGARAGHFRAQRIEPDP